MTSRATGAGLVWSLLLGVLGASPSQPATPHAPAPMAGESVLVVVAARDLRQGVPLVETDVVLRSIHAEFLPVGVVDDPRLVVGRKPTSDILVDEPVQPSSLAAAPVADARAEPQASSDR